MGMPPNPGGRHRSRIAVHDSQIDTMTITAARPARPVVDGRAIAGFAYAARVDAMDDTAPMPVWVPGPRSPHDGPAPGPVRIDAGTQRLFAVDPIRDGAASAAGVEVDPGATVAVRPVRGGAPDGGGRHRLTVAGATAAAVCAAYIAGAGVSALHGTDDDRVGSALAGLVPPGAVVRVQDTAAARVGAGSGPAAEQVPPSSVRVAAPPTVTGQGTGEAPDGVSQLRAVPSSATGTAHVPTASTSIHPWE